MIQRRTAIILSGLVAITAALIYQPPGELFADSSAESFRRAVPRIEAAPAARGTSGEVKMQFVRAGERVALPLVIRGTAGPVGFRYQWVEVGSNESADVMRPLDGDTLLAPLTPGFYELAVMRNGVTQRLEEPRIAVLVPFELKLGSTLNGYQIGRYPAEWSRDESAEKPLGFAECKFAAPAVTPFLATLAERYLAAGAVQLVRELRQPEQRGRVAVEPAARWLAELAA